ncbi:MAG: heparan-alpha-glucosaminide N-acetyltransferase domain-containing protein, partial [Clostridia bacterium]
MTDDISIQQSSLDSSIKTVSTTPKRVWELDALRGFCVILMVMDHTLSYAGGFYGQAWYGYLMLGEGAMVDFCRGAHWYWFSVPRTIIHPIIFMFFILICGISCGFSKSNLKRGFLLVFVSAMITFVTSKFDGGEEIIRFGVLHMLSVSIIIWSLIQIFVKHNNKSLLISGLTLGLLVALLYIIFTANPRLNQAVSNSAFWFTESNYSYEMSPGDIFVIIPWAGIFFIGAGLTHYLYPNRKTL